MAAGVVPAGPSPSWGRFRAWLDEGRHAEMTWLERDADARRDPQAVMSGCRSILAVALPAGDPAPGNVARYARGEDYHVAMKRVLRGIRDELRAALGRRARFRACVDTAPLLEREVALRAGLGFLGKNGLLIVPGAGSHLVLGELLSEVELEPTVPAGEPRAWAHGTLAGPWPGARALDPDRCADCTRCLDACPTGAFVAPRVLDAARCLSYLTIEKRGPFDDAEARAVRGAGTLFGCDVCQDVCPWNASFFEAAPPPGPWAGRASLPLAPLLDLGEPEWEARFAGSAVRRATLPGLKRNARALLGADVEP